MKTTSISTFIAIALLTTGTAFAQGGRRGGGYGGSPKTEAERAARQEQCQQANGGNCPNNGVCDGTGAGRGQGKGQRRGPRGGGGNCPLAN